MNNLSCLQVTRVDRIETKKLNSMVYRLVNRTEIVVCNITGTLTMLNKIS